MHAPIDTGWIATSGESGAPIPSPLSLFGNGTWNGMSNFIIVPNGAAGTDIQDVLEVTLVVNKVPEPASLSLMILALLSFKRRRR